MLSASFSITLAVCSITLLVVGLGLSGFFDNNEAQIQGEGITGKGHFTMVLSDSFGNVKSIKQSPNAVMNGGENCVAKMIFGTEGGDTLGNGVCTGAINEGFRYICLDEDAQILIIDKDLRDPADSAGLSTCLKGAITWNQNSTGSTDALSKVTGRISATFTNSGADETIAAAGLFNGTSLDTRAMLAKANSTAVLVTSGSDLTVHYDFEYGGGTVP